MGGFQRAGIPDQDPGPRRHAGAGHNSRRRGEAERAGAGDHQHRHRIDGGLGDIGAGQQPAGEGEGGQHQHGGDEPGRDLVGQLLHRRLGHLGVLDQPDDAGEGAFRPERGGFYHQQPFAIDRAADHRVGDTLHHRHRFAGQQGFVGL